ncbi:hypothetical protein TPAR_07957 [Tolypocladium paradoxum]|uniref:DUF7703 domain-containing protein n=1 Tax=Tolypocladium paradoxum TaxID=94208 RepID=A0A2S4KNV8_9HYPO|nr:hypothetical protein TPAR_07957 [Tolypocladium paradoxum]
MFLPSTTCGGLSKRAATNYSAQSVLVIVCSTLALYNALELLTLIFMTFKRRKGLYFWSISLASFGVIPYSAGWILVQFNPSIAYVGMIFSTIGWVLLVSGQSVVLYSRLHLVLNNANILRGVLWMIICNGLVWHTSITVLLFGSTYSPPQNRSGFINTYSVMEKVQMTFFCLQEFIISGLYIWMAADILRTALGNRRRFMWQLFAINVLIVIMDIGLLAVEYKNHFVLEQGLKVVIYSIKLKLEFAILGQLVEFIQHRGLTHSGSLSRGHTTASVELSGNRPRTGLKHARSASMPEAIHMEELQANAAVSPDTSSQQGSGNSQNMVTETIDENGCVLEPDAYGEDHLYENAIRQISRQ